MDPMTAFAVANVVVSGVSMAWNYFSGQGQISEAKKRKTDQYNLEKGQIGQQYTQGLEDIASTAGNETAVLAAKGIEGPFAGMAVNAAKGVRTGRLDQWKTGAMSSLDLGYKNAMSDLNQASDQLNMDTLMGSIGIGLSAAGTMVDAGMFDGTNHWTDPFTGDSAKKRKSELDAYNKTYSWLGN